MGETRDERGYLSRNILSRINGFAGKRHRSFGK